MIILQAHMKFPSDYPYSPPSIRFLTKVWHPNVYEVCYIITYFIIYQQLKCSRRYLKSNSKRIVDWDIGIKWSICFTLY